MTQRAPLYSGVGARNRSVELLTWTRGLPPGRIGDPVPTPIRDRDIRNPAPKPLNLELRTWTQGLPPGVIGNPVPPIPQRALEWPNPKLAPVPSVEIKTWIQALPPGEISRTIPKAQRDWPNPQVRVQNFELRTWIHSQQVTAVVAAPFVQSDWPNPRGATPSVELKTWIETLPPGEISRTIPKAQRDWPNPTLAKAPGIELRTWSRGLPPGVIALTLPPNQYDWPNPLAPRARGIDLRTWTNRPPPILPLPPAALAWTNPKVRAPDFAFYSWQFKLQLQPTTTSAPFFQTDWPNPVRRAPNLELRSWLRPFVPQDSVVVVPNVVGDTAAQADAAITAAGLEPFLDSSVYSDTVAAGIVISQYPSAGTTHDRHSTVSYVLSLGPVPTGLPKLYRRYRGYDSRVKRGDRKGR
jgi:hypothetical protein